MGEQVDGMEEEELLDALKGTDPGEDIELKNKKGKKVRVKISRIDPETVVDDGDVEVI